MEDRLNELETKICFQDQMIEDLNTLLIEQQAQIDKLSSQIKGMTGQLQLDDPGIVDISLEVPPPHY